MELKKVKLKKLFAGLPVRFYGNSELLIQGLSSHSKKVSLGHLFIAKEGHECKGSEFIDEAVLGGASAILTDLYNPFLKGVTQVIYEHPAQIEGLLAKRFFETQKEDFKVIGITGTNGKTTTSYILRSLLGEKKTGLIGTVEYIIGAQIHPATLTTPDVISNHKMLSQMQELKLKQAVMEVTSHALVQNRVDQIDFSAAIFTNLSQDHLDYHKTMESYRAAKSILFKKLKKEAVALFNLDDPHATYMMSQSQAKNITYSIHEKSDYRAQNIVYGLNKTTFDLCTKNKVIEIQTPLVGEYNVYNTLAALALGFEWGIKTPTLLERLAKIMPPKGRLEAIDHQESYQVFVDFAHTEDALKKVLMTLKALPHNNLITVFGCGGDRDQDKRAKMGKVASTYSDQVWITSDNPRKEEPLSICEAIYQGTDQSDRIHLEVDRKKAIERALDQAKRQDIVLIAGRGHEPFQLIGHKRIPFSDAQVVKEILESKAHV